ncbi:Hypothetical predicted protein [Lecanosticta acicola]|uniref:Uncharacterized protein n=1 Tax=Lecanosticta acicola TaxID=111012 RepID=A0AAI8W204_9PEZI|nr:Hypothetical predicted protein [Lecanosticta acicola]
MAFDEPSAQLHQELRSAVQRALSLRRPVLHHLNADSSWLLQIPRPETAIKRGARFYYNILLDPWLSGPQTDLANWFSQQVHATPSAVQSIAELEELVREVEILASGLRSSKSRISNADVEASISEEETLIDAVAISHEFSDHCHRDTLLQLHPDVSIFAIKEAAKSIKSWDHFRTVVVINNFGVDGDTDWRSTSLPPLPEWIGISRLLQTDGVLNFHSALLITFNNRHGNAMSKLKAMNRHTANAVRERHHSTIEANEDDETAEAVIYTPHGIFSGDLDLVPKAQPPISTLAFLHGLHNVRIGTARGRTALQTNLGAHNGLKAQRILNASYWIGTHDEVKKGVGIIARFLQRDEITLKDALEHERRSQQDGGTRKANGDWSAMLDSFEDTNWIDLRNGESRILM